LESNALEEGVMTVPEFLVDLVKEHSGEMLILSLALVTVITLLIVLPQLLRANLRKAELLHEEHLRALEKGLPIPIQDERARLAARTALLVPMVVMIATGTVTSFIVMYKSDNLFPVSLAIWVVAGVVSLAAITGGVALVGRLAQIQARQEDEEEEEVSETLS
jgi:hypothetical protein